MHYLQLSNILREHGNCEDIKWSAAASGAQDSRSDILLSDNV